MLRLFNLNFTIFTQRIIPTSLDILVSILALKIKTFSFKTFIFYTVVNYMQSKSNHDNFICPMMQIFKGFCKQLLFHDIQLNQSVPSMSWRFYFMHTKQSISTACLLCLKVLLVDFFQFLFCLTPQCHHAIAVVLKSI